MSGNVWKCTVPPFQSLLLPALCESHRLPTNPKGWGHWGRHNIASNQTVTYLNLSYILNILYAAVIINHRANTKADIDRYTLEWGYKSLTRASRRQIPFLRCNWKRREGCRKARSDLLLLLELLLELLLLGELPLIDRSKRTGTSTARRKLGIKLRKARRSGASAQGITAQGSRAISWAKLRDGKPIPVC